MLAAQCPDGWADKSMAVYSAPLPAPPSGVLPNVVLTRQPLPSDLPPEGPDRMREFARRQLEEMRGRLRDLEVLDGRMSRLKGRDAAQMRISWRTDQARVVQWMVLIGAEPETAVVVAATAAEGEFERYEQTFSDVIASVELGA